MNGVELASEILRLKREKDAVILAHYYQPDAVQDIADFIGDSFALSRKAAEVQAGTVVFCGVRFMAETAAILAPDRVVLLPEKLAGCPLADTITAEDVRQLKKDYPGVPVVCYVNSSAEVKAESDICCTSANAVRVVKSLNTSPVLFIPDYNLGTWVAEQTGQEVISWTGRCVTHHRVTKADVLRAKEAHPDALVVVHPECRPEVNALADFVGSTSAIVDFVRDASTEKVLIGTEMGIMHRLIRENPAKKLYLLSPGLVCPNMKMNLLEKVYHALKNMEHRVAVPEPVRQRALKPLERMLSVV